MHRRFSAEYRHRFTVRQGSGCTVIFGQKPPPGKHRRGDDLRVEACLCQQRDHRQKVLESAPGRGIGAGRQRQGLEDHLVAVHGCFALELQRQDLPRLFPIIYGEVKFANTEQGRLQGEHDPVSTGLVAPGCNQFGQTGLFKPVADPFKKKEL